MKPMRMVPGAAILAGCVLLTACGGASRTAGDAVPGTTTSAAPVTTRMISSATARATSTATGRPSAGTQPGGDRCHATAVQAKIAPADGTGQDTYSTQVVLTNTGKTPCTLHGSSALKILTGGDGHELPIKQVQSDDGTPYPAITLKPGAQAAMLLEFPTTRAKNVPPDCLEGGSFVVFTLPGDTKPVEAEPDNPRQWFPPVCGAVTTTPWFQPG